MSYPELLYQQDVKSQVLKAMVLHPDFREVANESRLVAYIQSYLPCKFDTITRTARLVREGHPELRGTDWTDNQVKNRKVARQIMANRWGKKPPERKAGLQGLDSWTTTTE